MKKLKAHDKSFTKNELGEYWQSDCTICMEAVYAFKVNDVHFIFEDDLSALIGRPICKGCFEELKGKIPEHIDLIKKKDIERVKNFTAENIFSGIEKTHKPKEIKKDNLDKWIL